MSAAQQRRTALEIARDARARGWRPFPCDPASKQPKQVGVKPDGTPARFRWGQATDHVATDAELAEWFDHPDLNVGIACGPSGLAVVDADTMTALAQAAADRGAAMPTTYTVRTRKGRHYYFADPENRYGNNRGALKPYGVDVRGGHGRGGYVIAAGCLHDDGQTVYTVESDAPVSAMLPWIGAALEEGPAATVTELPGIAPLGNTPAPGSRLENAGYGSERVFTRAQASAYILENVRRPLLAVREGGGVNDALNNAAMVAGHFVPEFWTMEAAREYVLAALMDGPGKAAGWRGPDSEDAGTALSGLTAGMKEPYIRTEPSEAPDLRQPETPDGVPEGGQEALNRLVAAEWAREQMARRTGALSPEPASTSLTELLEKDIPGEDWRITDLWPAEGKVLLAAPRKAGKTTLIGNLVRCLVDGDRFLGGPDGGGFEVAPTGRRVVLLDFEMTERQIQRWLRDQGIQKTDLVHVELLRGKRWDPTNPAERRRWADYLRSLDTGTLIVDPAGPIVASLDRDENGNGDVRRFLHDLDALVAESGADELFVTHHSGHAGERSRGASAWEDWPDAIWRVLGEVPETFFAAIGRDVDQEALELRYDRPTRRLTLGETTRAAAKSGRQAELVGRLVSATPGINGTQLREALAGKGVNSTTSQSEHIRAAVGDAVHVHKAGRATQYFTAGQCFGGCPGEGTSTTSTNDY